MGTTRRAKITVFSMVVTGTLSFLIASEVMVLNEK